MTPKEKAINLFNSYVKLLPLGSNVERAKQGALIAVDEILNNRPIRPSPLPCASLDECIEQAAIYWKQVKQEINNL